MRVQIRTSGHSPHWPKVQYTRNPLSGIDRSQPEKGNDGEAKNHEGFQSSSSQRHFWTKKIYHAKKALRKIVKTQTPQMRFSGSSRRSRGRFFFLFLAFTFLALPSRANASFLHGETLDAVAGAIAWFAFIIVPPVLIVAFLAVHIIPEKIAEKRHHPQLPAIKCLCFLSLVFGGLLWPIAWLWAYSKPVLHKMAYGTDVDHSHDQPAGEKSASSELQQLRARVAELEAKNRGGRS